MKRRAERWSGRARRVGWTAAVLLIACRSGSPSAAEASASYRPWTEAERLECSEKASASLQVLQAAVADAPRACAADDDCGIYVGLPKCVYGCGLTAAVSDGSSIDAAIAEVDAAYCPAVCVPIPPPCPGESGFEAPRAACVAGACTLDTHETVVREAFQDTVYPLLRSNCQGCHSSEAQAQAPLIADPDVSQAFHATAHYFSWRGEGDRFWIDAPQTSRLVSILSTEQHDCWSECTTDAETLLQAVQAWSDEQERR